MENCVFCKIINGADKDAKIHYQDDDIIIINDKYPVAKNHILVLPKKHIKNAKMLTKEDAQLIEKMNEYGLKTMAELNADMNDMRSGMNWPPANTVNHLHQHFISPGSSLSFIRNWLFSERNYWFVNTQYILKRLIK